MDAAETLRKEAIVNFSAIAVQRTFRGYYSRRYKHDFHARRAYIIGVAKKGEHLRKTLQETLDGQVEVRVLSL
jgi:hypothetical protein